MRYVYDETTVILKVEDDSATIRTTANIATFNDDIEAFAFFENNNIDYSILLPPPSEETFE